MFAIGAIALAAVGVFSAQNVGPLYEGHGEFSITNGSQVPMCIPAHVVLPGQAVGGLDLQDSDGEVFSFYLPGESVSFNGPTWIVLTPGSSIVFEKRIMLRARELQEVSVLQGRLHYTEIPCGHLVETDFEMTANLDRYIVESATDWSNLR